MTFAVLSFLLCIAGIPLAFVSLYLALVGGLGARRPKAHVSAEPPHFKFDVIVPAHNESLGIASTVQSLLSMDYPAALRQVWVIADNCSDDTAERARVSGANVSARHDTQKRGKGYALEYAFGESLARGFADAVVVVDADTAVSPNLLHAFAARLDQGAMALQASYGVRNPEASWRTRLMQLALALFNDVRSLGRERLGGTAGLRGNGMCFTQSVLRRVPHTSFSLVEDLEYGIRLGREGVGVHYVGEAQVWGEMVSTESASRSQRHRWEAGRRALAKAQAWPLLSESIRRRNALLFDLGMDLAIPPLSRVVVAVTLGLGLSWVTARWAGENLVAGALLTSALVMFGLSAAGLALYVACGWWRSQTGLRGLMALAWAPVFMMWKLVLHFSKPGARNSEWVRTRREQESASHDR
ncbi:MAG: glycosyltransferase family 2 protein [Myxococcaceae bacterium]